MYKVGEGMISLAERLGLRAFWINLLRNWGSPIKKILKLITNRNEYDVDVVVAGGVDYHYIEQEPFPEAYRNYSLKVLERQDHDTFIAPVLLRN